jgi:hypothetical protein
MVFVHSRATVVGAVRATKDTITVGLRFLVNREWANPVFPFTIYDSRFTFFPAIIPSAVPNLKTLPNIR